MSVTNLQPIPKRFMVWDTVDKEFFIINSKFKVATLEDLVNEFKYNPKSLSQCIIIQSTNLFDKDGKEIFEGSIIENDQGWKGIVLQYKGQLVVNYDKLTPVGVWQLLYDIRSNIKVIGHVLSNPELLEERE